MNNRVKRHKRIRKKISGTALIPRMAVFRSNKNIEAQLIDDESNKTLIGLNTSSIEGKLNKTEKARSLGKNLGVQILDKVKVEKIVFDRGGYKYHGRVKALAEGLRESGIQF